VRFVLLLEPQAHLAYQLQQRIQLVQRVRIEAARELEMLLEIFDALNARIKVDL
jgi:hypothetical protein